MLVFPNAKINIGLHIIEKRTDGFHNIETVFYPLQLKEALEILPIKEKTSFSLTGLLVDGNIQDNLCMKAYHLLKTDFPQISNVVIHLHKKIPFGAGLGGGSSDAAYTIKLLNSIFALNLSSEQMQQYCRKLGSDCAFFIENRPLFGLEKGDVFTPCSLDLSNYKIVLVKPSVNISTAEAYSLVKPYKRDINLQEAVKQPISNWKKLITNDFESPLATRYPQLLKIKEKLYELGAFYASMTGSGSAFFGIFPKESYMNFQEKFPDCFVWEE